MIQLTEAQTDALMEVSNVGVSRAARQLSDLMHNKITLTIPSIELLTIDEVEDHFKLSKDEMIYCIYAFMQGGLEGCTMLMFHDEDSRKLLTILIKRMSSQANIGPLDDTDDILVELGNIVISSTLGAMSDMLGEAIKFGPPSYKKDQLHKLLRLNVKMSESNEEWASLAITTVLRAENHDIRGNLLMIFRLNSLQRLMDKLDKIVEK